MTAPRRILLIEGHPDPDPARFGHQLADAYAAGAAGAGHAVERIAIATLDGLECPRSQAEWQSAPPAPAIAAAQQAIERAQHIVLFYPLWLGTMPALLKAFLEQALRPGFAFGEGSGARGYRPRLGGRSARVVVTMGMPALVYRWWYGAHGLKGLERNILRFVGLGPIADTLIGMVEGMDEAKRASWQDRLRRLGSRAR